VKTRFHSYIWVIVVVAALAGLGLVLYASAVLNLFVDIIEAAFTFGFLLLCYLGIRIIVRQIRK
jgi:hypothetical protein